MGYTASDAEFVLREKIQETWGFLDTEDNDDLTQIFAMLMHDDVRPHMAEYIRMTNVEAASDG